MSIGSNIKRLRESHGLTQIQLGQIAGVTDKAVSTWESDIKVPRMGAIQKIADYFRLPKSAILDDDQEDYIGNKQIMAENIQRLMAAKGKDRMAVCTDLDLKYSTFSEWVTGVKYPRIDKIEIMAAYFGVSKSDLIEKYNPHKKPVPPGFEPMPTMSKIPVVGQIACGQPITAEENIEGYASAPERWNANFALVCRGRSMEPKIMDGDLVAIRSDVRVETGQIAAVRIGDEATLKKIYFYPERIVLRPINDEFKDIVFEGEEMNKVSIEGKAVGLCRNI